LGKASESAARPIAGDDQQLTTGRGITMSVNRENIVWQSKNGTWSRAFYEFWKVNTGSEDFDYEWDVEYGEEFNWVSTSHPSYESALDAWNGANAGCHEMLEYSEKNATQCEQLDAKAAKFKQARGSK
jgi:hypothetical protein